MVFFAQKVLRKVPGNWTFVVVTDREELDDQIAQDIQGRRRGERSRERRATPPAARTCASCCARTTATSSRSSTSSRPTGQTALRLGADVIVMTDEAHRTPVRHAGAQHARGPAQRAVPGLHRHAADRRRGADARDLRRLRLDLQLPAIHRGRRDRPALLREPHPELQLVNPTTSNEDIYRPHRGGRAGRGAGGEARSASLAGSTTSSRATTGWRRVAEDIVAPLPGPRLPGQGDGRLHRQGDRASGCTTRCRQHWAARDWRESRAGRCDGSSPDAGRARGAAPRRIALHATTTDMAVVVSPGQNEIAADASAGPRHRAAPQAHGRLRTSRASSRTRRTRCGWSSSAPCG